MKVITLTAAQISALAPLKSAAATALEAYRTAQDAYNKELSSIASAAGTTSRFPRLNLSDDGKNLIVN